MEWCDAHVFLSYTSLYMRYDVFNYFSGSVGSLILL